jgi:hypothetical protein
VQPVLLLPKMLEKGPPSQQRQLLPRLRQLQRRQRPKRRCAYSEWLLAPLLQMPSNAGSMHLLLAVRAAFVHHLAKDGAGWVLT